MLELVSFFTTAIQILLKDQFYAAFFVGIANNKKNASNPTRTPGTFRAGADAV